jgi:hypothetical protein
MDYSFDKIDSSSFKMNRTIHTSFETRSIKDDRRISTGDGGIIIDSFIVQYFDSNLLSFNL